MPLEINGYPLSAEACAVSLSDNDEIVLHMPGERAEQHTVKLQPTAHGMAALLQILKNRKRRAASAPPTISGDMSAPTQAVVEAWLADHKPAVTAKPKTEKPSLTPSQVDELLEGLDL